MKGIMEGLLICNTTGYVILEQEGLQYNEDINRFRCSSGEKCELSGESCAWYCKIKRLDIPKIRRRIEDHLRKGASITIIKIAQDIGVKIN